MLKTNSKWTSNRQWKFIPMFLLVPDVYSWVLKKACTLPHQHSISTSTISELKVLCSYHSMSFFHFHLSVYLLLVNWQMTSHVNWQTWRHNSISFVGMWATRLCQIGTPYTISYHNHIICSQVGLWIFHWISSSLMGPHVCMSACLSVWLCLCFFHIGD